MIMIQLGIGIMVLFERVFGATSRDRATLKSRLPCVRLRYAWSCNYRHGAGGRDENRPVGREGGSEGANVIVRTKLYHGRRSASRRSNIDRERNMLKTLWSQTMVGGYGTDLGWQPRRKPPGQ